jgi:sugar-phosphatase
VEQSWRRLASELGIDFAVLAPCIHGVPAEQVLDQAHLHLDPERRRRLAEQVQAEQADPKIPVHLTPGAEHLVQQLEGHQWAIVTSGDARLATSSMTKARLPMPPVLTTADDVARGKPAPDPYLLAASKLSVSPSDCIVIEDAPAGIQAAHAAEMRVIAVTTTHEPVALSAADWIIRDLAGLQIVTGRGNIIVLDL